jgi:hypothetical protein
MREEDKIPLRFLDPKVAVFAGWSETLELLNERNLGQRRAFALVGRESYFKVYFWDDVDEVWKDVVNINSFFQEQFQEIDGSIVLKDDETPTENSNRVILSKNLFNILKNFTPLSEGNILLNRGFITTNGADVTIDGTQANRAFIARINNIEVINNTLQVISPPMPDVGFFRIDLLSINSLGVYVRTQGTAGNNESLTLVPDLPINSVAIGQINLNDSGINEVSEFILGSFVAYSFNQFLGLLQQATARNNINAFRKDAADTRFGQITQNGPYVQNSSNWTMNGRAWVLNFPNDTHSVTSFTIKNTQSVNPGGMFMTERGSTIIRARGDSVTDYYILRLQGSANSQATVFQVGQDGVTSIGLAENIPGGGRLRVGGNVEINGSFTSTRANFFLNTGREENDDNHVVQKIVNTSGEILFQMWNRGGMLFRSKNSNHAGWRFFTGETLIAWIKTSGRITHVRSSQGDESARRDELNFIHPITITDTGKLNNVEIPIDNLSLRFSANVTEISGINANLEGKTVYITTENVNGLILTAQDSDSLANNRFLNSIFVPYRVYMPIVYQNLGNLNRWVPVGATINGTYVSVPETPTSLGVVGQRAFDDDWVYECIGPNQWTSYAKRNTWDNS